MTTDVVQQSSCSIEHEWTYSPIVRQLLLVMTDIIPMGTMGLAHVGGFSTVTPRYFGDHGDEHEAALDDIIENISDAGKDSYRGDMISDVNAGLGVMATAIRVISAILTVLGGTGNRR